MRQKGILQSCPKSSSSSSGSSGQRLVTLMVNPKQAELLQLVQAHGKIVLTMRNPLEEPRKEQDSVTLLSEVSQVFRRRRPAPPPPVEAAPRVPAEPEKTEPDKAETQPAVWSVIYLRGGKSQEEEFPVPEGPQGSKP